MAKVEASVEIAAPPADVFAFVDTPPNYPSFMEGVSKWEVLPGGPASGLGARIKVLMHVGAAYLGGTIEVVEWSKDKHIAWTSITGLDQRGRWIVRPAGKGTTRVTLRIYYWLEGGIAGALAERLATVIVRRNLRRSLLNLKREIEMARYPRKARAAS